MLQADNITVSYQNKTVFSNLSLSLPVGRRVALMGPSGCGKTTLMHTLCGIIRPTSGKVFSDDIPSVVFQEPRLVPTLTVEDNINFVLNQKSTAKTINFLKMTGLSAYADSFPGKLSGGMLQCAAIARALAAHHGLFLLDEPFKHLDADRKISIMDAVNKESEGCSLLLITHDKTEAEYLNCEIIDFSSLHSCL